MTIDEMLQAMRALEGFTDNVGMVLMHNGVVRSWSRQNHDTVTAVEVFPDQERIDAITKDIEAKPGIFKAMAYAHSGALKPGDDLLKLLVAGDVRENVIPALTEYLNRVKAEAVKKREVLA